MQRVVKGLVSVLYCIQQLRIFSIVDRTYQSTPGAAPTISAPPPAAAIGGARGSFIYLI